MCARVFLGVCVCVSCVNVCVCVCVCMCVPLVCVCVSLVGAAPGRSCWGGNEDPQPGEAPQNLEQGTEKLLCLSEDLSLERRPALQERQSCNFNVSLRQGCGLVARVCTVSVSLVSCT